MSDKLVTEIESTTVFADYLGIQKRLPSKGTRYVVADAADKRAMAVACALELIKGSEGALDRKLDLLSQFADQIQAALKKV